MRTTLRIVAIALTFPLVGCAGTQKTPNASMETGVPIRIESPRLSQRARQKDREQDQETYLGMTKVEGNVSR